MGSDRGAESYDFNIPLEIAEKAGQACVLLHIYLDCIIFSIQLESRDVSKNIDK